MMDAGVEADDFGEDGMQCTKHPYRNTVSGGGGGICAFCLQEKLGKLVSASSIFNVVASSSPSFRSDPSAAANALSLALRPQAASTAVISSSTTTTKKNHSTSKWILKRSKSAVVPRQDHTNTHKRGGFWSFLYHSKPKLSEKTSSSAAVNTLPSSGAATTTSSKRKDYVIVVDDTVVVDSPNINTASSSATASFSRKVSRSRSVGCGSHRFSGDFFDRFGDCTLRRVESQREGKRRSSGDVIHEKVRCAGIFSGFMMTSSTSSYWLSAAEEQHAKRKVSTEHSRSKSWGWALASPMRALGKDVKTESKTNATPNLGAIPSLLTARG